MSIRSRIKKVSGGSSAPETGFGTISNASQQRLLNKDGTANIVRLGERRFKLINIYHALIMMSWTKFTIIVFTSYIIVNLIFTSLYMMAGMDHIQGMIFQSTYEKFWEVFFFSAQTLTTVGYGRLNPSGMTASTIAALESFTGLLGFALATGLLYGKFSRPTAKLIYSENALMSPYKHPKYNNAEMYGLMFRVANARSNQLIEIEAQVLFSFNQEKDGAIIRNFRVLDLEIAKVSYLTLSWTIVHPITEQSPLYGLTSDDIKAMDAEFMINLKAIDDGYSTQVYSRSSYMADEVVFNAKFVSAISKMDNGISSVDLRMISKFEKLS